MGVHGSFTTSTETAAVDPHLVGLVYVVYFVLALSGEILKNPALKLIGTAWYFVVAIALNVLLRPVDPGIAWVLLPTAAIGCLLQGVAILERSRAVQLRSFAVFGLFLFTLGYLVLRSTLLPSAIGVALTVGGLASSALIIPRLPIGAVAVAGLLGMLAEGSLAAWLIFAT